MTPPNGTPDDDQTASTLADAERELTRFLRRFRAASQTLAETVHPELEAGGYGLLVNLFELLTERPDGVRASDLATVLHQHKSTTSRSIGELEKLGLLQRVPDPSDARARLVQFTDTGEHSLRTVRAARRRKLSESLSRWPQDDVEDLARLLRRLGDDLTVVSDRDVAGEI